MAPHPDRCFESLNDSKQDGSGGPQLARVRTRDFLTGRYQEPPGGYAAHGAHRFTAAKPAEPSGSPAATPRDSLHPRPGPPSPG